MSKQEQAQLRKLVDTLDGDLELFKKIVKHYFNNFNSFRGKYYVPYVGQVLYLYKDIQAHMLDLIPKKNDGQYDGNSATKMVNYE